MKSIFLGDSQTIFKVFSKQIAQKNKDLNLPELSKIYTKQDVLEAKPLFADTEYLFSTWGMPVFTEEEIRACFPNLKAVFYAAGTVQSFAKPFLHCGIRVHSAWAANAVPVAEYTVSQIVLANKGFFQSTQKFKANEYRAAAAYAGLFPGTFGCKVGIIGAGMIGTLVIKLLKNYHTELLVFDPFLSQNRAEELGVEITSLEHLFSECQTLSNHLANNAQTQGLLNYRLFSKMKDTATFINTGRGAQVVEEDLVRSLTEKPNRTAILDVTHPEPPKEGHPFYSLPNVFLTPHIAGSMGDEVERMALYMMQEYERTSKNEPCLYEVTPQMLETMA